MRTSFLVALIAAMAPATANASNPQPYVPPGNSAANEYVESVPTASGNKSTRPITNHAAGTPSSVSQASPLAPGTQSALLHQGKDGARAVALVRATAPAGARRFRHRGHRAVVAVGASSSGGGSSRGGAPPAATLLHALTGSGTSSGLGAALPAALILTALAIGAIALRRRHRAT